MNQFVDDPGSPGFYTAPRAGSGVGTKVGVLVAVVALGGLAAWLLRPPPATWTYKIQQFDSAGAPPTTTPLHHIQDQDVGAVDSMRRSVAAGKRFLVTRARTDNPLAPVTVVNHDEAGNPLLGFESGPAGSVVAG